MAVKREVNVHSTAVSGVLAAVRWELASVKGKVAEMEGEVAEVKGEVAEIEGEVEEVKEEVAEVKEKMAEVKGELAAAVVEKSRMPCIVMPRRTAVVMLLLAFLLGAAIVYFGKNGGSQMEREVGTVKWELARHKDAIMRLKDAMKKMHVDLQIAQSSGSHKIAWERIKAASQATDLSLGNLNGLSDGILHHVAEMTHLKSIDLHYEPGFFWWMSSSGFSAEGITHLFRLTQLEKLDLRGTGITDSALEGIGSLTNLRSLFLDRTKVTDAGLSFLKRLPSLRILSLTGCQGVTTAGMVHLERLTGLLSLWLDGTGVTDDGLKQLAGLTNLRQLFHPGGNWRQLAG